MKNHHTLNRYSPIGLDINSRSIYAIQLKRHGTRWQIAHKTQLFRHDYEGLLQSGESERLMDILTLAGFVGKQVVVSVPNQSLLYGLLELDTSNTPDISQVVAEEFAQMHGLDEQPFEMAAWALPQAPATKQHKIELLTAGCSHDTANHLINTLEQAGFDLLGIQPRPTAIAQWVHQHNQSLNPSSKQEDSLHAAIVCDWDETSLCLIHQDQLVYQSTTHAAGLGQLIQKITQDDRSTQQQVFHALNATPAQLKQRPLWQIFKQAFEHHWLEQVDALRQDMIRCSRYAKQRFAQLQLKSVWPVGIGCHGLDWSTLLGHPDESISPSPSHTTDSPAIQPCTPLHAYAAALGLICGERIIKFPSQTQSISNPPFSKPIITTQDTPHLASTNDSRSAA